MMTGCWTGITGSERDLVYRFLQLFLKKLSYLSLIVQIERNKKKSIVGNQLIDFFYCDPTGTRTQIIRTGILHSIH